MLRTWDGRLGRQGHRVLVCLDNFSGHPPELQLSNIKLVFFPTKKTANLQPMDQGIIEDLKCHYKKLLLCCQLEAMDYGKELKFTLLDAPYVSLRAWEQDAELLEIWEALPVKEKMHKNGEIEQSDFLEADEHLTAGGSFMLEEFSEEMLCSAEPMKSKDDEITVEEEIVPFEEVQRTCSTVRKFMQQRSRKPDVMQV
ncbi:tigger transposable element-derived protein 2-like [Hetaerina americana]|uniref:tigger transposable element-derived protein 2-like n=1 Tax=Hetaerina americana TaxID=62018 RepID=UPI003A7F52E9